jgi:hypothetical protein
MIVFWSLVAVLCTATLLFLRLAPATLETLMIVSGLLGAVLGVFLGAAADALDWVLRSRRDRCSDPSMPDSAR